MMFDPHAAPVEHMPVYQRIGIGEMPPAKTAEQHAREAIAIIDATLARIEAEEMVQSATACAAAPIGHPGAGVMAR